MTNRQNASNKKVRLLAIESHEHNADLIKSCCREFGFLCEVLKDSGKAHNLLSQRFYSFVLFNPESVHGKTSIFIGNLRNIRGYEKVPLLVLSKDNNPDKDADYLNEGCDAVIHQPLSRKSLHANLNLFLRRDLFERFTEREFLRKDLNQEQGKIVLCSTSREVLDIPVREIQSDVTVVINEEELFRVLYSENVWIVLIGIQSRWALGLTGRLKNDPSINVQLIILRNNNVLDASVVDFFNQGGDDIMSINKPAFILSQQLNSRMQREYYFKDKYVSALKSAADKLPIRSEERMNIYAEPWLIDAFHRSHQDVPGGDFYEIINGSDGSRTLILGDVMGKEWGAWFFSLAYLSYIRSTVRLMVAQELHHPAQILERMNDVILRDFKLSEIFTTLSIVHLPESGNLLRIASASGLPLLKYSAEKNEMEEIKPQGPLLGLDEEAEFHEIEVKLNSNDFLWLFTDGYLEEMRRKSIERFSGLLSENKDLGTLQDLDEKLLQSRNSGVFEDDRTIIRISN